MSKEIDKSLILVVMFTLYSCSSNMSYTNIYITFKTAFMSTYLIMFLRRNLVTV